MTTTTHLIPFQGGWAYWNTVWLRTAGFPAQIVLDLTADRCAAAMDALFSLEEQLEKHRQEALDALDRATRESSVDLARQLGKAVKRLRKGELPASIPDMPADAARGLEAFAHAQAALRAQHALVTEHYAADQSRISQCLRSSATNREFREAVLWQNRNAVHGTIEALLRRPLGATDSKTREHERLVASYVQRYATKNDTIGFFGPVAWAELLLDGPAIAFEPGPSLISKRTVYFEHWTIDALASHFARDIELRVHLPPRRLPHVRVVDSTAWLGLKSVTLPPAFARILQASDGQKSAKSIAETLIADSSLDLSDEAEVYDLLEQIVENKLATWTLEVPVGKFHPDLELKRVLNELPSSASREKALADLAELSRARDAIASAAGAPERLDVAIGELETVFTRITGETAHRRSGQVSSGRTLLYEDCVRDVSCAIGPELAQRLGRPLSLILESAQWHTQQVAKRYREAAADIFARLSAETGSRTVDYLSFWSQIEPLLGTEGLPPIVSETLASVQKRWASVLGWNGDTHRIDRTVASLEAQVKEQFASPQPGWPAARFHSPDVLIAASSLEAIRRGEYTLVLGELHVAVNSLFSQVGLAQHPDPEEIYRAGARDVPEQLLFPVESKIYATRADQLPLKPNDPQFETGLTRSSLPRDRVVAIADLVITEDDGRLMIESRDGRYRLDVISFLGQYLTFGAHSGFPILAPAKHMPRVTIDGLVVQRETWTLDQGELPCKDSLEPRDQFVAVRRWQKKMALPRFVFFKVPEEPKPIYLDFDSPPFVDIFVRKIRKASGARISEMLPNLDELWITDKEGRRYASELRIAAVSPNRFTGP